MGSETSHRQKFLMNKEFLCYGINERGNYNDWTIVVMFYCTVHIIEYLLSKIGKHPKSHEARKTEMVNLDEYNLLKYDYDEIYTLSRTARYEYIGLENNDVIIAQSCLENITKISKISIL